MKDCCKTGSDKTQNKNVLKKWFNYILYVIIAAILVWSLVMQLTGN